MSTSPMPSSIGISCVVPAVNIELRLGATLRCRHAITLPFLSKPASMRSTETGRKSMDVVLTGPLHLDGAPSSFDSSAASSAKSHFDSCDRNRRRAASR